MTDNLRANQSLFQKMHDFYGSKSLWSVNHPISNGEFEELFVLYDPTHLLKNIRNNWVTEKTRTLKFTCPETGRNVVAKWSDLVAIYNEEMSSFIKHTRINYASLYPTNFEKQKVALVLNIFNEKTVAALKLRKCDDTALFVEHVTKMWNMLNIKTPHDGTKLNNDDRYPFTSEDDCRFDYLHNIARSFKLMDASQFRYRITSLTADTSNALHMTLNGIIHLTRLFLTRKMNYVITNEFLSDRIEAEFGIWRQLSGGNYHISMQQVLSSLSFQRLKLFHKLQCESSSKHEGENCCLEELSEEDWDNVATCFQRTSSLSDNEKSTFYYISGYVAKKDNIIVEDDLFSESETPESEFLHLVSRGKLTQPREDLFDLC